MKDRWSRNISGWRTNWRGRPSRRKEKAMPLSIAMDDAHPAATSAISAPKHSSFEEFLRREAKVPNGGGLYGQYSFEGREALLVVVKVIDRIIDGKLTDAEV